MSWTVIGLKWFLNCPSNLTPKPTITVLHGVKLIRGRLRFFLDNWSWNKTNAKRTASKLDLMFEKISFEFALVLKVSFLIVIKSEVLYMDIFQSIRFQFTFFQFQNFKFWVVFSCKLKKLFSEVQRFTKPVTARNSQNRAKNWLFLDHF